MRLVVAIVIAGCGYNPLRSGIIDDARTNDAADAAVDPPPDAPPDAPMLPACPSPPTGCTAFECAGSTSCYYACPPRTWTNARDQCVTDQIGCLVTIDSAVEDTCLFANTGPIVFPDHVWFGFRQASGQPTPDDGWSWQCGTSAYVAPNWGAFEPNDNSGSNDEDDRENCASIGTGGAWFDIGCGDSKRYVCELPR